MLTTGASWVPPIRSTRSFHRETSSAAKCFRTARCFRPRSALYFGPS